MALPSQMPRSGESVPRLNTGSDRTRSASGKLQVGGLIAVGLVLIGVWWFWPQGPKQTNAADLNGVFEPASTQEKAEAPKSSPQAAGSSLGTASNVPTTTMAEPPAVATSAGLQQQQQPSPGSGAQTTPAPSGALATQGNPGLDPNASPTDPTMGASGMAPSMSVAVIAIEEGRRKLDRNDPVGARDVLNRALFDATVTDAEKADLRNRLSEIAEMVTFSQRIFPGDPMADTYTIVSGDRLSKIPAREGFRIDYRLLQRLNGIKDPNAIRVGQKLKALYGPFHATVDKSDFRLDLFADQEDSAGNRLFITSYRVGLGEMGSTPLGTFKVKTSSKLIDPKWVNPRTGQVFQANDPKNPIGERWIGLEGTDDQTKVLAGYGIHGTIDPDSIGKQMSMGCVRMSNEDVEVIYDMLVEDLSTVTIVP